MIWRAFLDLHAGRIWSDMGTPEALRLTEIEAWGRLHRRTLTPDDLMILRTLDGEYRASLADAAPSTDADDDWSRD